MVKPRKLRNRDCGQAIAESAAALYLITTLLVAGVLLILFVGSVLYYKIKLAFVAQQVAGFVQNRTNFIGVPRPNSSNSTPDAGPNPADIKAITDSATAVANDLLKNIGLPNADSIAFKQSTTDNGDYWTVTITERSIPIPGGLYLPSAIALTETGSSVDNTQDVWGYSLIVCQDPINGSRGIVVPVLAFSNLGTPTNPITFNESGGLSCKFGFGGSIFTQMIVQGTNASNSISAIQQNTNVPGQLKNLHE
jgi:hypothetical protein